jgi:hypothetical protein
LLKAMPYSAFISTRRLGARLYLASVHAAQALIFERTEKTSTTHSSVHTELLRLTKDDPRLAPDLRIITC